MVLLFSKYSSIHEVLQVIFTFAQLILIAASNVKKIEKEIFSSTYSSELKLRGETTAFNDQSKLERTPIPYEI